MTAAAEGSATVADVIGVLERLYPPELAEDWDVVGLAVGSRSAPVQGVLYTVDVTLEVVREAVTQGADLIVAHHPLLLRPLHAVDLDSAKGRIVAELIRHGLSLYVAHTNADVPARGVVDSLADALGLVQTRPLRPGPSGGLGRVGVLTSPLSLRQFAERVAAVLPATGSGIRVSGDWDQVVRSVAVQAGAGDDLLAAARAAGVDVYLTSDLRHHPASEARAEDNAPALVDVAHWAAESLWLPVVSAQVADGLQQHGLEVAATVSAVRTDPWNPPG